MRCNFIREKKILCGDEYLAVGIFPITPVEHKARRKKARESSEGQKAKNKMSSMRRVIAATCKRFGVRKEDIRLMLAAVRKGEQGRLHFHGFAECRGLDERDRREWREMLEDLWRRRIPGTNEFEPLGTINVDRMDMKKLLGKDGTNGTMGYLYGHKERLWVETNTLCQPVEQLPNDTRWSRKQLRTACGEMKNDAYWWSQRFPGWELQKCVVLEPGELNESAQVRENGWERTEPQCYVILKRADYARDLK